jgi:hypothetical protein
MTTPTGEAPAFPLDKLARAYRNIRKQMQDVQAEYDDKMEVLKEQQQTIKNAIKDIMLGQGATSTRTPSGTVVLTVKTRYNTNDWDAMRDFILKHEVLDLLERRLHQTNMAQFLEENPGLVPPGLNAFSEYDVSVRKPSS